jgi:RHS repeat-associated protein
LGSDYTYDAFDRRIIKSFDDDGPGPHSAAVTKTIYDGADFAANPYVDFDGSNNVTMRYLHGPAVDMLLARRDSSGSVAWYLTDHLATVRDLVNTTGTLLDHISYSAYGKVNAETNPSNGDRFKFTGYQYDSDVGLYHARARSYDSTTGRFISADPVSFSAGDANLYRYVENQATTQVDRLGLAPADPGGSCDSDYATDNYALYMKETAAWEWSQEVSYLYGLSQNVSTFRRCYRWFLGQFGEIDETDYVTTQRRSDYQSWLASEDWPSSAGERRHVVGDRNGRGCQRGGQRNGTDASRVRSPRTVQPRFGQKGRNG